MINFIKRVWAVVQLITRYDATPEVVERYLQNTFPWHPVKSDVLDVCRAVREGALITLWVDKGIVSKYCKHCDSEEFQLDLNEEPSLRVIKGNHYPDCPVLKARDVMTRIGEDV